MKITITSGDLPWSDADIARLNIRSSAWLPDAFKEALIAAGHTIVRWSLDANELAVDVLPLTDDEPTLPYERSVVVTDPAEDLP